MSRVEVLAPLRIETRFAPAAGGWTLHLRVYPDEFSLARPPAAPTLQELDILEDALAAVHSAAGDAQAAELAAYRSVAAALGARRAWWLWRSATVRVSSASGTAREVDRFDQAEAAYRTGKPLGLPQSLAVWLMFENAPRRLAATLHPREAQILEDLEVATLTDGESALRATWWRDYARAKDVGLGIDIALTAAEATGIASLFVVGAGNTNAAELIAAHAASGRLAVLPQGTPTNTVNGESTAPSAEDPESWLGYLEGSAQSQPGASAVLTALGVSSPQLAQHVPIPGGELEHALPGSLAVRGLWPALWGRTLRDVVGARIEPWLARWAGAQLAVQGPVPAIRVGEQPYGLLPTSSFKAWLADADDDAGQTGLESAVLAWSTQWCADAAAAVAASTPVKNAAPVVDANERDMLRLLGRHAPSQHWRVRPVADLAVAQAIEIQQGLPLSEQTTYDKATAAALREVAFPLAPIAPVAARRHLPGPERQHEKDIDPVLAMIRATPVELWESQRRVLGLLGHLVRESLLVARAAVGRAILDHNAGMAIDAARSTPLDDDFHTVLFAGTDASSATLRALGGDGVLVAERLEETQRALERLVKLYAEQPEATLRAVKAALDTATFRVDPWLTSVAARRLRRMAESGAPSLLGAYGWVDAPRPFLLGDPEVLKPGPTAAGLLHAPSFAQAQVAAVLRDAAVRNAADKRWELQLTAARVRRAIALGERVRLGVHPFEALGLEVEALAGDPDLVRLLRTTYPTTAPEDPAGGGGPAQPNDPTRRVCDGIAVLDAARDGTLPAAVRAGFAAEVAPLSEVLDTYADLLLVDGVHALVTRSPEAGGTAMEAAAGLGTPPGLWGIRTPREASQVPVSCWVVLPPGAAPAADAEPSEIADPACSALLPPGATAAESARVTRLLGGTEGPADPSPHNASLAAAMTADLSQRRVRVVALLRAAIAQVDALQPDDPAAVDTLARLQRQWRFDLPQAGEDWTVADCIDAAGNALRSRDPPADATPPGNVPMLQEALRALVGRSDLPVLPIVSRDLLPPWQSVSAGELDRDWLEVVAAVRPRLTPLEARQLVDPWPAALLAPGDDPWAQSTTDPATPVQIAYGPGLGAGHANVAVALLDAWVDSIPSRHHVTHATFGFNAPKTRAPQGVLLAVPAVVTQPLTAEELLDVVAGTRELALARAARPTDRAGLPWATPSPIMQLQAPVDFLEEWP